LRRIWPIFVRGGVIFSSGKNEAVWADPAGWDSIERHRIQITAKGEGIEWWALGSG
jgi:hypothetical protein